MNYDQKMRLSFLRDELTDMTFYIYLSNRFNDMRETMIKLSKIERKHSEFWRKSLESEGIETKNVTPRRLKIIFLKIIILFIGRSLTINLLEHGEYSSIIKYKNYMESSNGNINGLKELITEEMQHEDIFESDIDRSAQKIDRSRDFLYGMSDGLVEVLAALTGLTAIIDNHILIALSGVVIGISGTFSMTLGAYLSQKTESDYKITRIKKINIFNIKNESKRIDEYKKEANSSALATAISYVIGAVIPILPFVFLYKYYAIILSVFLVAMAQGISNSIISLSMGIAIIKNAIRASMLALGAALVTFLIGYMFHIVFHISVI
ncbi:VIT1/CCC1 transporter family protein [Picrophilus oshimae]|uniref:Hypothetical DUF 125 protein n=1 Tax=Picrophilus torridus (strain ATCC 700027 / DSM 9790 / JCM 10055 / NBRC 100828 / KAW 2/3) TaxID=1122961 RepID=Q6L0X7_PICTO|nr:VIT1/CCC1 transporter family protein [Picrophilus oshimae]AAT43375.1 hypothetical DUF 125 protein [Picrophilus oshimae DSM 9789]